MACVILNRVDVNIETHQLTLGILTLGGRGRMAPHREWDIDCKVYIGGLSEDTNKYDLEDAFSRYGRVKAVWVARRPPGFGFVEMDDPR